MLRIVAAILLLSTTYGCTEQPANIGTTSSVPATKLTEKMVGTWGLDGQVGLIIQADGDQVVISAPLVDGLKMDISDAVIQGDTIKFIQKNYFLEVESHPFNGVANNSTIKMIDENTLEYRINTIHLTEEYRGVLSRIKSAQ